MEPKDFITFRNIPLLDAATADQTSTVGEPTVANNGRNIFATGNWYASTSTNNGNSLQYINPYNTLPPAAGGFCCDQVAIYDRSRDIMVWLLQYITRNNTNVLRIAINRGPAYDSGGWYWWDFSPVGTNSDWSGEWFDYPDLALSSNHLWLTSNVFRVGGGWTRAVVFKFPLDALAAGTSLGYQYYSTTEFGSLRLTQGAKETMYFASHKSTSAIRIFSWPDMTNDISWNDVDVAVWNNVNASAANGTAWMSRTDRRITGAWVANNVIGLAWTVGSKGSRPFPHVRVVRVNEQTKALVDEPDLWSNNAAYAYPAVCPNDRGHLGLSIFYGGGDRKPSFLVGISDDYTADGRFALRYAAVGTHAPADNKWGDYLTVRRHSPDGLTWHASGFTLQGGNTRQNIVPRIVHFGRRRDRRAVQRWINS